MATAASRHRRTARKQKMTLLHAGWAGGERRILDIREGDTVEVIGGRDVGKRGVVERVLQAEQRVVIAGVNVRKRHTRANQAGNVQGGIVDFNAPIAYSNAQLVCNRCDKKTRISHVVDEAGARFLVCKRCGERYERAGA
ncbi:MAG: 50S ribosomal protein L24 [Candidatus Dormibacteria bacterium]